MARKKPAGRLVAVEGTRGQDVARAARRVWETLKDEGAGGGVSAWDASGTFYELRLGKQKDLIPTPRTLLLLYASDLAFRLRWQIRPAIAQGQTVVAAPYVESAIAFGEAAGLPRKWLTELFRFAPKPDLCLHAREKKASSGWKDKWMAGFLEFSHIVLKSTRAEWDERRRRAEAIRILARSEGRRGCRLLKKKSLRELTRTGKESPRS